MPSARKQAVAARDVVVEQLLVTVVVKVCGDHGAHLVQSLRNVVMMGARIVTMMVRMVTMVRTEEMVVAAASIMVELHVRR